MICPGKLLRINFRGWQVLQLMINNQLDHVIIIVHLAMADIDTYEFVSVARGYHQYWSVVVGEELPCRIELSDPHDLFTVAVCKSDIVVGHMPKIFLSICSSFLR